MSLGTGVALALSVIVTWFALAMVLGIVLGRIIRRRDEQHLIGRDQNGQTAEDNELHRHF